MYSVQQLQALDYLLKRITNENSYPLYQKNLKLVVEINNSYWYGDFVRMQGNSASQLFIDDSGDIELNTFPATGVNAISVLKQIWDSYTSNAFGESRQWWSNPFKRIDNLALLFDSLIQILGFTQIKEDSSPLHPYLLNACSLDGKLHLPFINLNGEKIKLVSIIEIKD